MQMLDVQRLKLGFKTNLCQNYSEYVTKSNRSIFALFLSVKLIAF